MKRNDAAVFGPPRFSDGFRMRGFSGGTVVLLLILLCAGSAVAKDRGNGQTRTVDSFGPLQVGEPLPTFAFPDPQQGVISTRTLLSSGEPLLLSFWAIWCKYCIKGMDRIQIWKAELEEQGEQPPTMLFINLIDKPEFVEKTSRQHRWNLPIALDRFGSVGQRFGLGPTESDQLGGHRASLPLTILTDADGRIRTIFTSEGADFIKVLEREWRAAKQLEGSAGGEEK